MHEQFMLGCDRLQICKQWLNTWEAKSSALKDTKLAHQSIIETLRCVLRVGAGGGGGED